MSQYKVNNLAGWNSKFMTEAVQNNNGSTGSDFLSSESVVMFSGPPDYNANELSSCVPIGLVQNVQVAQQKQLQQLFEIGSRKPIFIPGRTMISGGIARILFDGPSLMYAMNLISTSGSGDTPITSANINKWTDVITGDKIKDQPTGDLPEGNASVTFKSDTAGPIPSYFFINLASSFFNKPAGLGFILYDMESQPYGGFYMENCYIQAHTFSVASQQTVLVENVSFRASSLLPLDIALLGTAATKPTG